MAAVGTHYHPVRYLSVGVDGITIAIVGPPITATGAYPTQMPQRGPSGGHPWRRIYFLVKQTGRSSFYRYRGASLHPKESVPPRIS